MNSKVPYYIIGIVLLLISTNLQFVYNVDFFFTRSIGIVFFITFILGFLFYRILNPFNEITAKVICYSMGLSIGLLMFSTLIFNYILITYTELTPLLKEPLLILFNAIAFILIIIHIFKFSAEDKIEFNFFKHFKIHDGLLMFIATLFPFFSYVGTSLLNNNVSNSILIINLGAIALFIVVITIFWKYIHNNVFPYALFMIGLSILFNISLRSWFISGSDILTEYRMFQSTLVHGYWANFLENHSYNACISITILPTIYAKLLNMSEAYIFKFLFQIFFAIVPVIVYVFSMKFANHIVSFLSGILFIAFPIFVNSMSMHIRQEIAFLFFALMILAVFEEKINFIAKLIMLVTFGYGMIISHYSTTFIALALLSVWYFMDIFLLMYIKFIHKPIFKKVLVKDYKRILSIFFIILMYAFSFFWYTQVVNIGANLQRLNEKIITNLPNMLSNDVRVDQTSLANQFNIFYKQKDKADLLRTYINETNRTAAKNFSGLYYEPSKYKDYVPVIIEPNVMERKIHGESFSYAVVYMELIKKAQKILTIIGVLIIIYMFFKSEIDKDLLLISATSLLLLLVFMVMPFFTIEYDIMRTTQQLLVVLSFCTIAGGLFLMYFLGSNLKYILMSIFIVSYFLVYTNFYSQVIGGFPHTVQFNNEGVAYERFFVYDSEIKSIHWLEKNKRDIYLIQSDPDSFSRIMMNTLSPVNSTIGILPSLIYRNAYVYLNHFNVNKGITYKSYQGETLRFTIPNKFLDENKDLLYNNRNSKVYQ